jgi:hypothetical protein
MERGPPRSGSEPGEKVSGPSNKEGPAKNPHTIPERLTHICLLTWVRSERVKGLICTVGR